jgi:hypothetical protein
MYIDPSAGGMIFQVLAVLFGLISGGVLLFSSRIKMGVAKMRRRLREKNQTSTAPVDGQPNSGAAEK